MRTSSPATATTPAGQVDEAALQAIWPRLVRLGRLLTGSQEQGEDIAQEAIVGLLRHDAVLSPEAYLRRSVVNLSINHTRRSVRERTYLKSLGKPETIQAPVTDEIWPIVKTLPARQRAVLVLRYYEDLSESDIAAILDCRPGTVKSLAARGLARLQQEITS